MNSIIVIVNKNRSGLGPLCNENKFGEAAWMLKPKESPTSLHQQVGTSVSRSPVRLNMQDYSNT